VFEEALAVDAGDRFPTAGVFVENLQQATTQVAVEAEARRRRRRTGFRSALTVAGILAVGGAGWLLRQSMVGPVMDRLAVLPFENALGDSDQDYYVAGVYAELVLEMSKALLVTSRGSAEAVAAQGLRVRDVATELEVDGVLTGRVSVRPETVEVALELADGESEEILWSDRFEAAPRKIFDLYRSAVLAISENLQVSLEDEELARLAQSQEVDPRVHQALLQARFNWQKLTPEGFDTAEDYYRQAIELSDSSSGEAWWGLSRVPNLRAQMGLITGEEAQAAREGPRQRALELGIDIAAQEGGFGAWSDWQFEEAERVFRRSLELDPTNSVTRVYFAHLLLYLGKEEEAVENAERAAADDPYNSLVLGIYGQFLNFVHRYDEAEAAFRLALEREPNDPISLSNFRTTYHLQGRFDEAVDLWKDYYLRARDDSLAVEALERGYAEGGYRAALRAVGDEFVSRDDPRLNWQIATLYTRAGEGRRALDYLELATAVRDPNMPYILVDPIFDFLREEPRFQALVDTLRAAR
jgi:TolB-like protein/Tfp pilus assembly protein PilF